MGTEKDFTVSGVSSGGYMAVQLHVAHSARVKGAGILAAGPYYCAHGSLAAAYYNCTTPRFWTPLPTAQSLYALTDRFARAGDIDATSNLKGAPVWLFSGRKDDVVLPEVVFALRDFYTHYGARVTLVSEQPAGHAMVTDAEGDACGESKSPFINACKYDAAGELLRHLLGGLRPAAAPEGRTIAFDQKEFAGGDARALSLDDAGYAYVPKPCEAGGCRVHVALHGCLQGAAKVGDAFVRRAGYNRWAQANRIVVLYPQAISRSFGVFNPLGCWDWWGYSGAQYATRAGPQVRAIVAMVERLAARR